MKSFFKKIRIQSSYEWSLHLEWSRCFHRPKYRFVPPAYIFTVKTFEKLHRGGEKEGHRGRRGTEPVRGEEGVSHEKGIRDSSHVWNSPRMSSGPDYLETIFGPYLRIY